MSTYDFIERLSIFGLTKQEAVIYQCLLIEGKQTGYEIAKSTQIARSNVYSSVASLVEKGAAYALEESAKKYTSVPLEEFCDNQIQTLLGHKKWMIQHAPIRKVEEEGYITINGEEHILHKVKQLLTSAQERVYLSCKSDYLLLLEEEIKGIIEEQKKLVIITDYPISLKNIKVYLTQEVGSQIGIIVDSKYVLTGEYGKDSMNTCLYSGKKNFVELYKKALSNEIKLIQYKEGELTHE